MTGFKTRCLAKYRSASVPETTVACCFSASASAAAVGAGTEQALVVNVPPDVGDE
jgi:hypothetical protein